MRKFFLDTNFVIDYLLREEYKFICQEFLEKAIRQKVTFYISFLSIANFAYIARKLPKETLYTHIAQLMKLFNVIACSKKHISNAIKLKPKDFEDGLQYQAAIEIDCDCIITRNVKDFSFSAIPVISAEEYLSLGN